MNNNSHSSKKIAIVTGAAGSLGSAVVENFVTKGLTVAATIRKENSKINNDALDKYTVDLTDEKASAKFVDKVISKHGNVDIAVLTAGGFEMGKIGDTSLTDLSKQMKLNFETAYNIARPVFVQMLKQGEGRIFLIGSKAGLDAKENKGKTAYGLSKLMLFRLAELMNLEAKESNVVINVVVPGTIDTPANRESMPGADFSKWAKPEDIAEIIYWYSTEPAKILRENIIKVYDHS